MPVGVAMENESSARLSRFIVLFSGFRIANIGHALKIVGILLGNPIL